MSSISQALGDYFTMVTHSTNSSSVDFSSLASAIQAFQSAATLADPLKSLKLERYFLSQNGLPGRPFYRHVIQAPGE